MTSQQDQEGRGGHTPLSRLFQALRRWFWRGHSLDAPTCPACPFPDKAHDHARNQMARGGFY